MRMGFRYGVIFVVALAFGLLVAREAMACGPTVSTSGWTGTDHTVCGTTVSHWYTSGGVANIPCGVSVTDINVCVLEGATWVEYDGVTTYNCVLTNDTLYALYPGNSYTVDVNDLHHHPGSSGGAQVKVRVHFSDGTSADSSSSTVGCP